MYIVVSRRIERNAQYFRDRNIEYKGFSFGLSTFFLVFFGKIDVFEFTQRNYNGIPTEP